MEEWGADPPWDSGICTVRLGQTPLPSLAQ